MKKITKPYSKDKDYNCFGCSPHNPIGLNMEFYDAGDYVQCIWEPERNYEGFHNILHGGIQATLIDEIAAWCVNIQGHTAGVTSGLNVEYLKPVRVSEGAITLKARMVAEDKRIFTIEVVLLDGNGEECTRGKVDYYTFPPAVAKRKFNYPGIEAFYED